MTRRAPSRQLVTIALALGATIVVPRLPAQTTTRDTAPVLLWPTATPGALGDTPADRPTITPYLPSPEHATGAAAVIFPGGGYEHLATDKEGTQVARWLNGLGVAAFVVQYRLGPRYHAPIMQEDALRAVRVVRARAASWKLDPDRIGVVGFSAGGHMASTAGTRFDAGNPASTDPVERLSSRPSFMLLAYPVVTMREPYAHRGSRTELLGAAPSAAAMDSTSNELHVPHDAPPTFIVATSDDATVPVENSLLLYHALHTAGVPVELHLFEHGRHGFGLAASDPVLAQWTVLAAQWLRANGFLTAPLP